MWAALEIAQAKDFVAAMPGGLEAPIAQGGTNVSGGQRQRLSIARALVRKPELYLFDDSFSALDLATDARLRRALKAVTRDATVVIVAQRVSTIKDADQIVVLEDGAVVGLGTHESVARNLRDLRRDRRVTADGAGGLMNARTMKATERIQMQGGPGRGMGGGTINQKAMSFRASGQARAWTCCGRSASRSSRCSLPRLQASRSRRSDRKCSAARPTSYSPASSAGRCRRTSRKQQAIDSAIAQGQTQTAELLSGIDLVPGQGIDFAAVGNVLLLVLALYAASALLSFLQGYLLNEAVQRTIFKLRSDVEDKLNRLPLRYFDANRAASS